MRAATTTNPAVALQNPWESALASAPTRRRLLRDDLAAHGVVSKRRTAADGSPYGGQRCSRGALYLMLKNRIYRGEIVHKGKSFPGEHVVIVDEDLWRRVQSHLEEN